MEVPLELSHDFLLKEVNHLMQRKAEIEHKIQLCKFRLLHPTASDDVPKKTAEMIAIPYEMLHLLLAGRNALLKQHKELLEEKRSQGIEGPKVTILYDAERISMVNSAHAPNGISFACSFTHKQNFGEIIQKFSPSPRIFISDAKLEESRTYGTQFLKNHFYDNIPQLLVEPLKGGSPLSTIKGPGHSSAGLEYFADLCCSKSISTYPLITNDHKRLGDPICDRYFLKLYENRVLCALADGCGWGESARSAAKKASKSFVLYLDKMQKHASTLQDISMLMLKAFSEAHKRIVQSAMKDQTKEPGNTTLTGSLLLRVRLNEQSAWQWVVLYCSVGDAKIFYYSKTTRTVRDITKKARSNIQTGSDPGGRLGGDGAPDLRNLSLGWEYCEENDLIIVISDGVYDNLDLRHQGYLPSDVGLPGDDWNSVDALDTDIPNTNHVENQLATIIHGGLVSPEDEVTPDVVCLSVTKFCEVYTENTRVFMTENPTKRLPKDYTKYPGKVDHASVVCFKVCPVSLSYDQWMGK